MLLQCLQLPVVAIFSLLLLFGCWSTLKWPSIFFLKLFYTVADCWAVLLMVYLKSFMDFKKFSNTLHFQELTSLLWTCLLHVLSVLFGGNCPSEVISGIRHEATCKAETNTRKDSSLNFFTHLLIARWKFFVFICVNFSVPPLMPFFSLVFLILSWLFLPLLVEWLHFSFSTYGNI